MWRNHETNEEHKQDHNDKTRRAKTKKTNLALQTEGEIKVILSGMIITSFKNIHMDTVGFRFVSCHILGNMQSTRNAAKSFKLAHWLSV